MVSAVCGLAHQDRGAARKFLFPCLWPYKAGRLDNERPVWPTAPSPAAETAHPRRSGQTMFFTVRRVFIFLAVAAMLTAIFAVDSPALSFVRRSEAEVASPKTNAERMARGLSPLKPRKVYEATPAGRELNLIDRHLRSPNRSRCSRRPVQAFIDAPNVRCISVWCGNRNTLKHFQRVVALTAETSTAASTSSARYLLPSKPSSSRWASRLTLTSLSV